MTTLFRRNMFPPIVWNPLAEFERLADEFWGERELPATYARLPYADVTEEDGSLVIKAELPGIGPEEIDISLNSNVVTIKAEHREGEETEGGSYYAQSYYRSMELPEGVDFEKAEATMENGLLVLRFPKAEAIETKHVEVKALKEPKPKTRAKRARKAKKKE